VKVKNENRIPDPPVKEGIYKSPSAGPRSPLCRAEYGLGQL
jgi:hypothetical protein